jgi:hypothetical protein
MINNKLNIIYKFCLFGLILLSLVFLISCTQKQKKIDTTIKLCNELDVCSNYDVNIYLPLFNQLDALDLLSQLNKKVTINEDIGRCFYIDSEKCWYYIYAKSLNKTGLIQNAWITGEIDIFTGNIKEVSAYN